MSNYLNGEATAWPADITQEPQNVYFIPPKNKNYNAHWLVLWQDESEIGVSLMEQAKSKKMTLSDYRVRDYLMATIGIGNFVYVNQSEIARILDIHKVTVCESIKRLCEMQIIIKGPKSGKSNTYMVNPAFCFMGKLELGIQKRNKIIKSKIIQFSDIKHNNKI